MSEPVSRFLFRCLATLRDKINVVPAVGQATNRRERVCDRWREQVVRAKERGVGIVVRPRQLVAISAKLAAQRFDAFLNNCRYEQNSSQWISPTPVEEHIQDQP